MPKKIFCRVCGKWTYHADSGAEIVCLGCNHKRPKTWKKPLDYKMAVLDYKMAAAGEKRG